MPELGTPRLLLRQWREADFEPFAALNADPEVMRYYPSAGSREQSEAFIAWASGLIAERGWGLWAVEVVGGAPLIGLIGLNEPRFKAHFTPAVEVGWRLARNTGATAMRPRALTRPSPSASRSWASMKSSPSRRAQTTARGG